jgi:hypothetical protein
VRRLLPAAALLLASCAPEPLRIFTAGVAGPVNARVAAEARRLGLAVEPVAPSGAAVEDVADEAGRVAPFGRLRFLAGRAVAGGSESLWFRLPPPPAGRDLLDFPEEWQAFARLARELEALRPVLEAGAASGLPFAPPPAVSGRAWSYAGRRYVLLVNRLPVDVPVDPTALAGWRALFEARADPREALPVCGPASSCLPPEGVLWLEGPPREER